MPDAISDRSRLRDWLDQMAEPAVPWGAEGCLKHSAPAEVFNRPRHSDVGAAQVATRGPSTKLDRPDLGFHTLFGLRRTRASMRYGVEWLKI